MEPFDYLQNNANEMATVVETYLVEETTDLIYDNDKLNKWNELVAELNLEGQNHIRQTDKSPIPFLSMNAELKATFSTLCPSKISIDKYNLSSIPLEILDLVKLSNNEKYFSEVEIWYDEKQKDPLCVGVNAPWRVNEHGGNFWGTEEFKTKEECQKAIDEHELDNKKFKPYQLSWQAKYWLIGRWADVKQSLSELKARAKERFIFEKKNQLSKEILDKKRELEDLELNANLTFGI